MPEITALKNAPDISFIEDKTVDEVRSAMVADYEAFMTAAGGQQFKLERSSAVRMVLYAAAAQIYQCMQYIDRAGKQNLLKYSYADWLDNLALLKGLQRIPAGKAQTTIRFELAAPLASAVSIPKGTRLMAAGGLYFATDDYAEIRVGAESVDVSASCTMAGAEGNGLAAGEINVIVDPVAYVAKAANISSTSGGADRESDADLAERIYLAPSSYSTAGPEAAYIYHAKNYSPAIGDVSISSDHAAGRVDIVFLMADGTTPQTEVINGLQEYLRSANIRPMTDLVQVSAPQEVTYNIALTYYVNRSDSGQTISIQNAVTAAVAEYTVWQRVIGRDINPSKLVALVMAAGAKRVEVTAPVFTAVSAAKVAKLAGTASVAYGGLEDD